MLNNPRCNRRGLHHYLIWNRTEMMLMLCWTSQHACMLVVFALTAYMRGREKQREKTRERSRYLALPLRLFVCLHACRLSVWGLCRETKHAVISVTSLAAGTQHTPQRDKAPRHSLHLSPPLLQQLTLRTHGQSGDAGKLRSTTVGALLFHLCV